MQGKISVVVPISSGDYEVIKVLQEYCFTITDIRPIEGNSLLLEIEAFTSLGNEDTN